MDLWLHINQIILKIAIWQSATCLSDTDPGKSRILNFIYFFFFCEIDKNKKNMSTLTYFLNNQMFV